jgi:hypothetical protein
MINLLSRSRLTPPASAVQALLSREQALQIRLDECLANAARANEETARLQWNTRASEVAEKLQTIWEQLHDSATGYVDLRTAKPFAPFEGAPPGNLLFP